MCVVCVCGVWCVLVNGMCRMVCDVHVSVCGMLRV